MRKLELPPQVCSQAGAWVQGEDAGTWVQGELHENIQSVSEQEKRMKGMKLYDLNPPDPYNL